jgi:hypothetical protein
MMKLKKDQFKKILKECILELINEGAFDKVVSEGLQESKRYGRNDQNRPAVQLQENYDSGHGGFGQLSPNERLREMARTTAHLASGGNKKQADMLSKIFEDTAMTTLQAQLASGDKGNISPGMFIGEQADPQVEMFEQAQLDALSGGRGAKHWAALAFGTAGSKK